MNNIIKKYRFVIEVSFVGPKKDGADWPLKSEIPYMRQWISDALFDKDQAHGGMDYLGLRVRKGVESTFSIEKIKVK